MENLSGKFPDPNVFRCFGKWNSKKGHFSKFLFPKFCLFSKFLPFITRGEIIPI